MKSAVRQLKICMAGTLLWVHSQRQASLLQSYIPAHTCHICVMLFPAHHNPSLLSLLLWIYGSRKVIGAWEAGNDLWPTSLMLCDQWVHFGVHLSVCSHCLLWSMEVEKCTLQWYFMKSAVTHLKLCMVGTLLWVLVLEMKFTIMQLAFITSSQRVWENDTCRSC